MMPDGISTSINKQQQQQQTKLQKQESRSITYHTMNEEDEAALLAELRAISNQSAASRFQGDDDHSDNNNTLK